jgi:hypothetical protein
MQFALLIYESPEAFAARKSDDTDPYTGAWRSYHKALVESGVFVGRRSAASAGNRNHHKNEGGKAERTGWSVCRH